MRVVCRMAREILDAAHAAVRPGVTTDDIDRVVSLFFVQRSPALPNPSQSCPLAYVAAVRDHAGASGDTDEGCIPLATELL